MVVYASEGIITVEMSNIYEEATDVYVYNIAGQAVASYSIDAGASYAQFNAANIGNGIFVVKVANNNAEKTSKVSL